MAAPLLAQPGGEKLTNDRAFFEEQAKAYQRWLDHSGLGTVLKVQEIDIQEKHLSIYLAFHLSTIDGIANSWKHLKTDFEANHPLTLEQQLFYKATTMMEVRQELIDIQVYDTYDLRKEPLFFRGIFFEDGGVKVETSDPRSEIRDIAVTRADLSNRREVSAAAFQKRYSRRQVYSDIITYVKRRFERDVCDDRYPQVRVLENDQVLRFEVEDLCREVLTDEANPVLADVIGIFGYDLNWVKRELLTFTIIHQPITDGFRLSIEIDGKYGSGIYSTVSRGGYLNMEIDFDDYLERYADRFKTDLQQSLFR